jgi:hypothetical protein
LAKAVWFERAKIGEEPLIVFKIFHTTFHKCKQKRCDSEKGMGIAPLFPLAAGQF